jgi:hypothetical protein
VTNPFNIANYASLQTSNPALYARLAANAFFTSSTIPRHRLLRAFPHMSNSNLGLRYNDQPLGVIKAHSLEVVVTRRYSGGLTANGAFAVNRVTENRTVEEYDRAPTLWQTNNNGRPWRVTGTAVYELPFGTGKPLLATGLLSKIAGGWTVGGAAEYQPGALLNWNNLFFSGNLDDIKKNTPEIALRPDGTFDPTKTWFNIDAGFERDTADQPAGFQKRAFRSGSTACAASIWPSYTPTSRARSTWAAAERSSSGWTFRTCSIGSTTPTRTWTRRARISVRSET